MVNLRTICVQIERKDMEKLKKYTGKFQALRNQYFWLKEARGHGIKTIGLEETPEEKALI